MSSITHTHTITYNDPDNGISVELPVEPESDIHWDADNRVIRWATHDPYCDDYDFPEGVGFIQSNSRYVHYERDPQGWLDRMNDDPSMNVFPVGIYEHSGIDYSLAGESLHSSDPWDYCVGACIAIPDDFTNPSEAARAILKEYTAWCNGWVYTVWEMNVDTEVFECCGGFYGTETAEEIMENGL